MSPNFNQGFTLALILSSFLIGKSFHKSRIVKETIYTQIEKIKQIKHLEFVTYYSESVLDVAPVDRSDKVYLQMTIPTRVSSYIDLEQMKYRIGKSLITISLPEPIIDSQVPNLDSAKVFNLNKQYVMPSKKRYETIVPNVESSLIKARQDALIRAEAKGIRDETRRLGERYFESLFTGLGYKIEFVYLINPEDQDQGEPHNTI